jgi:predicted MFS family arabinose efflux permease
MFDNYRNKKLMGAGIMRLKISVFFCLTFVIGTDTFIVSPLLPTFRQVYAISVEQSGWIVSAYALGYAALALVAGPLSDGWDRKTVMIAGMVSFGLFTFLCGFAGNFWIMILFRLFAGMSAAIVAPQVWAAIPQLVPRDKVLKAMGIATAGLAAAQMLGVPIGSYLAVFGWRIPFFAISASSFLLVLLIAAVLPTMPSVLEKGNRLSIIDSYRSLLRQPGSKRSFLAYFIFQMGNFAAFSFIGIWLSDQFKLSVAEIGTVILFLGFGNLLSSFFSSGFVRRIGVRASFTYGMLLVILIYVVLPFLPLLVYVKIAYFLLFFLLGMLFPIIMSVLQNLSSTARGTISSLANSFMYFGTTIGSSIAGMLYANIGGFVSISIFTVICFLVSLILFLKNGLFPTDR